VLEVPHFGGINAKSMAIFRDFRKKTWCMKFGLVSYYMTPQFPWVPWVQKPGKGVSASPKQFSTSD